MKEDILKEARQLFDEKGYQHVSMREIAKQLGCSHGALYYHYKNKAELFYELIKKDFARLDDLLDKVSQQSYDSPIDQLKAICFEYICFCLTHRKHFEMMFIIPDKDASLYEENPSAKSYEKFSNIVHQLCPQTANITAVFSLFVSLQGFVMNYLHTEAAEEEWQTFALKHVAFITRGMR